MSRIFISESTGAAVYLFADDHCPPHVHARHRSDEWIARVQFSLVNNEIGLMSITHDVPYESVGQIVSGWEARATFRAQGWHKQIVDARYDPVSDRTRVIFQDGTATDVRLQA